MKNKLFLILVLLLTTGHIHAQWEVQLDLENYCHLDRIFFLNDSLGWTIGGATVGASSPYFYTTDGGQNWYLSEDWWDVWETDIAFINPDTGFIASGDGIIFKTVNAGQNWTEIQTPATQDVIRLFFVDENNGWATLGQYNEGYIISTYNSGVYWNFKDVFQNTYYTVNDLFFINDTMGWTAGLSYSVSGDYNSIKKTTDGGENWLTLDSISSMYLEYEDVFFIDSLKGWLVGKNYYDYLLMFTDNGGENWEEQTIEEPPEVTIINCVYFINDTIGWIGVGEAQTIYPYGAIYCTNDGGDNWQLQQEFESAILDIQMLNQDTGWAVGGDFAYHITNATVNIKEKSLTNFDIKITPNPTNGIISLYFSGQFPVDGYKVVLTSITGNPVLTTHLNNQSDLLAISSLPSGIYFITINYTLGHQNYSLNKKIVKL